MWFIVTAFKNSFLLLVTCSSSWLKGKPHKRHAFAKTRKDRRGVDQELFKYSFIDPGNKTFLFRTFKLVEVRAKKRTFKLVVYYCLVFPSIWIKKPWQGNPVEIIILFPSLTLHGKKCMSLQVSTCTQKVWIKGDCGLNRCLNLKLPLGFLYGVAEWSREESSGKNKALGVRRRWNWAMQWWKRQMQAVRYGSPQAAGGRAACGEQGLKMPSL